MEEALELFWPRIAPSDARYSVIRSAWTAQAFGFAAGVSGMASFVFLQHVNGPCGPLTAVQARMLSILMEDGKDVAIETVAEHHQKELVLRAIGAILKDIASRSDGTIRICVPNRDVWSKESTLRWLRLGLEHEEVDEATDPFLDKDAFEVQEFGSLEEYLEGVDASVWMGEEGRVRIAPIDAPRGSLSEDIPGTCPGVVAFCLSVICTRGVDRLRRDMAQARPRIESLVGTDGNGEMPLMNLFLSGEARTDINSMAWEGYLDVEREKTKEEEEGEESSPTEKDPRSGDRMGILPVGFLTDEAGYHPCALLRMPKFPVWVTLSGGHYSVMWSSDVEVARLDDIPRERKDVVFFVVNGLKPRFSAEMPIHVSSFRAILRDDRDSSSDSTSERAEHPLKVRHILTRKLLPTEEVRRCDIEDIGGDGFEYVVVCDPSGSLDHHEPGDRPPPTKKWYCRDCFLRHGFTGEGYNDPDAETCGGCHNPPHVCGWAHSLSRSLLPESHVRQFESERAPAALQVLRSRFPRAVPIWLPWPGHTEPRPPRLGV